MKILLTIIVALILVGAGIFYINKDKNDLNSVYTTPYTTPSMATSSVSSMIRVTSPLANTLVKSPLVVTGQARGNWYFEASFPVRILDGNGKELGVIPAQAQGEWMTTSFVPFHVILSFATSTTDIGTLVLERDNPSGLPQNAAELRIPIRFR